MRFYTKSISAVLASALLLTGCGDSNDSANSSTGSTSGNSVQTKQGVFIDDVVAGLKYVEGNESGLTDANGRFPYKGGTVGFYLGKIKIGEISSLSSDNKVFVQDLFNVDRSDINDSRVLKIATLLQSIDANSSTDEIEITSEVFNKFDGNVTQADSNQTIESLDVDELLRNKGINKVPKTNVERHLRMF